MYPRKKKVETYKKKDNFFKSLPDKQKVYPLTFINEELKKMSLLCGLRTE